MILDFLNDHQDCEENLPSNFGSYYIPPYTIYYFHCNRSPFLLFHSVIHKVFLSPLFLCLLPLEVFDLPIMLFWSNFFFLCTSILTIYQKDKRYRIPNYFENSEKPHGMYETLLHLYYLLKYSPLDVFKKWEVNLLLKFLFVHTTINTTSVPKCGYSLSVHSLDI